MAKKKYKIKERQIKAKTESKKPSKPVPKRKGKIDFPFTRQNYIIFAVGLLVIIFGFIMLATGDITLSPILLILGYCVLIPIAILYKPKEKSAENQTAQQSTGD